MTSQDDIRTRTQPTCHICGGAGDILYRGLTDRLFGVPGEWTMRRCNTAGCGLLWLDPMPLAEDLPELYKTYYTHDTTDIAGDTRGLKFRLMLAYWRARYCPRDAGGQARLLMRFTRLFPGIASQLDSMVFFLPARSGGRLLDVGCGSGLAMQRLTGLGWHVEGVDFDEKAVWAAQRAGLDVRLGDVADQEYPADSFDAVVMSHVIEHVPDPRSLIVECCRILKPGGQLVVITPNSTSWGHRQFGCDWRGLEPPRHLHIFNVESLQRLAAIDGFGAPVVKSNIAHTHTLFRASHNLRKNGRFDMTARAGPLSAVFYRAIQWVAALKLRRDPTLGEEVVLQVEKTGIPRPASKGA